MVLYKFLFYIIGLVNFIKRFIYQNYYKLYALKHSVKCGTDIKIYGRPYFTFASNSYVSIGNQFICRSSPGQSIDNSVCSKITVSNNAKLIIGDFTGISNTTIECHKEIIIGNNVNIGAGSMIFDTDFHSLDWKDRYQRSRNDIPNRKIVPVHIGDSVFIGTRCIICKGVIIGDRSIIAAGSVVVKSVPSDELWGGNPAKFIKKL